MREIYAASLGKSKRNSVAKIAVFSDESAYKYMTECALRNTAFNNRRPLGYLGAPYDMYDISDFEDVYKNYKAIIFASDTKTGYMAKALDICKKNNIGYLSVSNLKKEFTPYELRAFCASKGVHIYCDTDDILYINSNYLAIHSVSAGEKTVYLSGVRTCKELLTDNGISEKTDTLKITMNENETKLFELS